MRHVLTAILVVIVLPLIALFSGFLYFAQSIETTRSSPIGTSDAIVALTGGALRIDDALELLSEAKARRLLISGVNAHTSREQIRNLVPQHDSLFDCCVDLDRDARDTTGNAIETAQWLDLNHFRSVIVVTSSYHMPRAMFELENALDGVEITPYPVILDSLQLDRWWTSPSTMRLLISEYFKYLASIVRIRFIEPYLPPQGEPQRTASS